MVGDNLTGVGSHARKSLVVVHLELAVRTGVAQRYSAPTGPLDPNNEHSHPRATKPDR